MNSTGVSHQRVFAHRLAALGAGLLLSLPLALAGCGGGSSSAATAAPFAIHDPAFLDPAATGCISILKITGVSGNSIVAEPQTGSWAAYDKNGALEVFCPGAFHTWIGALTYAGYTFASDAARPLEFSVYGSYTYAGGKGTVTLLDGSVKTFDSPEVVAPWLASPQPS